MPLAWNEIRQRSITFAREWRGETRERAEAQTFWNEFFAVFGIPRRTVASFEEPVRNLPIQKRIHSPCMLGRFPLGYCLRKLSRVSGLGAFEVNQQECDKL